MFDLTGKTALITGGSYGLGVVFAHALADAGADIALTARSTDLLEKNAAELAAKGRKATAHTGDVTVLADVQRVVDEVTAAHGKIDVLVNNEGVSDTRGIASENVDGGYSAVMGANQLQVPWHLWNVPSAIGETYPGMAPLPDTINQQRLPGVHFPIPDRI
jgi:NAD(P)-dependent dehydrogenase (short-subunit alcohol dehydrogenase family)